jgi:glycosyltransferase involved in cell wall biosynthesis
MSRVLFFHQGKFSHTAEYLLRGLRRNLPETDFRTVDLHRALKSRKTALLARGLEALRAYGGDLLRRRRTLDDAFFGTRSMFEAVRQIALDAHKDWPADCSIQTQSMYDCSRPGTPHLVYTDHTYLSCTEYPDYGRTAWNPVRPAWLIDLERTVYEHAACTLTMSSNVSRTLVERYGVPPSRVLCVRAGCNVPLGRLLRIPRQMRRYLAKTVLFVGLEWQRKGGPQLVQALRLVRREIPDVRLVVVGTRPDIRQENVHTVGRVDPGQLVRYYADASVFCMPSRVEPFGIAWLEAMATGLPAIGLNLGAAPDFIRPGETGVLVEPDDVHGLARALIDLLTNPQRCRTLGEGGRAMVASEYTWERTCSAVADRIARLCEPQGGDPGSHAAAGNGRATSRL